MGVKWCYSWLDENFKILFAKDPMVLKIVFLSTEEDTIGSPEKSIVGLFLENYWFFIVFKVAVTLKIK